MLNKAQLERFFVGSVMLAFVSLVVSIVGIKTQLFQNIQYLLLFISSVIVLLIGIQAKSFNFFSNRLKKQITGWLISSIFSALIWAFAQKGIQTFLPAIKAYRKAWNTLEPFALYATVVFILFALILIIVGARDSKIERPGYIERFLVYNLSSKIAAMPMIFTSIGVFIIAFLTLLPFLS